MSTVTNEPNHLEALSQFIMPNLHSPSKMPQLDEALQQLMQGLPIYNQMIQETAGGPPTLPPPPPPQYSQFVSEQGSEEKQSTSDEGESSRQGTPGSDHNESTTAPGKDNNRNMRQDGWFECFNTTKRDEFEALIYSLYVIEKDDRKLDGHVYYECINRLQNKCRYKVRVKQQDEFFIVEEKGGHNHALEPVGQAGSHAGLPKTLREIVDRSFHEDWSNAQRQAKIDEEVKRMGLPPNPRLGRQVDNRVAYLRRVKNLNETKKIQDQVNPTMGDALPQMMQMMLEQGMVPVVQQQAGEPLDESAQEMIQRIMASFSAPGASPAKDNTGVVMMPSDPMSNNFLPCMPQNE
ncbi:unnamed protein product [Caenorhabditis auriculariae]|uniref:FLYWCH-type domain-containing protein n=1 Tax=Caenorhabditis auriculariae TaxID=2777116 RepID=A0A8S1HDZ1_9PELO|nr:unnamed protein product [Caenorhabditis auriculariae]